MDWDGAEDGFDYGGSGVIHYDGVHFPFEAGSFDLVFHTEVTEHVRDAGFFMKECRRVLRGGGETAVYDSLFRQISLHSV